MLGRAVLGVFLGAVILSALLIAGIFILWLIHRWSSLSVAAKVHSFVAASITAALVNGVFGIMMLPAVIIGASAHDIGAGRGADGSYYLADTANDRRIEVTEQIYKAMYWYERWSARGFKVAFASSLIYPLLICCLFPNTIRLPR